MSSFDLSRIRVPMVLLAALLATSLLGWNTTAQAQAAGGDWDMNRVLQRVQRMDPRLRVRAAEQSIAEIGRRRARWDRVQGGLRLEAGHQVLSTGWAATRAMPRKTTDSAFAAAVAEVRVPIYAGGRISAEIDAAEARLRKARYDEDVLRLELASTALVAFAQALAARDQQAVSERARNRARNLLQMTQKRQTAGIDTEADVARAQLNLIRYEEELVMRREEARSTLMTLRAVLLLNQHAPLRLAGDLQDFAAPVASSPPSTHPEIARSRAALSEARAARRASASGYLPSVELFATAQYGNAMLGAPSTPQSTERWGPMSGSAIAGVQAGWTLWDFFVTRDRVATADAQVALRRAEQDVTSIALRNRRDEAMSRQRAAVARVQVLRGAQRVAARALGLARASYASGNATLTEVLDSELEAIRLETRRVQAGLDLARAQADRMVAEGSQP